MKYEELIEEFSDMIYAKYQKDIYGIRMSVPFYDSDVIKEMRMQIELFSSEPCKKEKCPKYESNDPSVKKDTSRNIPNDVLFDFEQTEASNVWIVAHNLKLNPNATVTDLRGNLLKGVIEYITDGESLTITFDDVTVGRAYLFSKVIN